MRRPWLRVSKTLSHKESPNLPICYPSYDQLTQAVTSEIERE